MAGPFEEAGQRMIEAAAAGLYQSGIDIMFESQILCPVDTGVLKASARVNEPEVDGTTVVCVLGYGYGEEINPKTGQLAGQYAIPVHEIAEAHHEPPTQWKYLEQPVLAYIDRVEPTLAAFITRAAKTTVGDLRTWLEEIHGPSQAVGGIGSLP